jgi:hypothetical protein
MAGAVFEHVGADVWRITASMTTTGPAGPTGPTGPAGAAATVSVGTTTTLAAGSQATVTNSGTSSAAVFDFGIPQGAAGTGGGGGPSTIANLGRLHVAPFTLGGTSSNTATVGQITGILIYLPAGHITRLAMNPPGGTGVTGTVRLGVYTLDRSNPANSALLVDGGTADAGNAAGTWNVVLNQAISEGWYLLAVFSNEARDLYCVTNGWGQAADVWSNGAAAHPSYGWNGASVAAGSVLPATFGGSAATTNIVPLIAVEIGA